MTRQPLLSRIRGALVGAQPPPPTAGDLIRRDPVPQARFSMTEWAEAAAFSFGGTSYGLGTIPGLPANGEERVPASFVGFASAAFHQCGPVFACILARQMVFAEGRFAFRRRGEQTTFGTPALGILERPWPGGTAGELLARMEQDASLAGNSFWIRRGDRLARLRPDRVRIVIGQPNRPGASLDSVDAELLGYVHVLEDSGDFELFLPDEVAHYSPIPDPVGRYRGISWLQSIVTDIDNDLQLTTLKRNYYANGARPSGHFHVSPEADDEIIDEVANQIKEYFVGPKNAGRVLITSAEWSPMGHTPLDSEIRQIQGAGETRIAAAAGVPPVVAGFSEGLSSATYSNYSQARRRFADGTMRPLWRIAADSLANLVDIPAGADLVVDASQVAALREDGDAQATILTKQAAAISTLIMAGYAPDAAVGAVSTGDLRKLVEAHTGLASVQLQPLQPLLDAMSDPDDDGGSDDAA